MSPGFMSRPEEGEGRGKTSKREGKGDGGGKKEEERTGGTRSEVAVERGDMQRGKEKESGEISQWR